MLLDRLEIDKMMKVLCPLESCKVEQYGFPITVPEGEDEPTKPLCFVCGSAGIKQVYNFMEAVIIFAFIFIRTYSKNLHISNNAEYLLLIISIYACFSRLIEPLFSIHYSIVI